MIISASRRTDIPAFYSEWLANRIKEGYVLTRNPFNANQIRRISLLPNDVDAIVFWTRNPVKLIEHFSFFDDFGYKYYFQYTITGYPRLLEKSVPHPLKAIDTFCRISDLIGPGRVVWRYDPILLSNQVDVAEHKRLFSKIAGMLSGKTSRVVVSFADLYKKTERNLNSIATLQYSDISSDHQTIFDLARHMRDVADRHRLTIQTCAEKIDLGSAGIRHGKCIDEDLLEAEFGLKLEAKKDKGQREECGCVRSIDIGQYNTCAHGCAYCYANFSNEMVAKNKRLHDPTSPFLVGRLEEYEAASLSSQDPGSEDVQLGLF